MDWSDIIEYMSMSDEDFAYEAGLTKEKVKNLRILPEKHYTNIKL